WPASGTRLTARPVEAQRTALGWSRFSSILSFGGRTREGCLERTADREAWPLFPAPSGADRQEPTRFPGLVCSLNGLGHRSAFSAAPPGRSHRPANLPCVSPRLLTRPAVPAKKAASSLI